MPDLSPQPPQPQEYPPVSTNGDGDDPLAKLHRMSRTAGMGAQDYVAINVAAVIALLLGFASALAMVTSLLLVIPMAGVICGIVALYQIRGSNGTQTGRGLAASGIALSVLFVAVVGGREIINNMRTRADREAVIAMLAEFGRKLQASDFQGAYAHFSPRLAHRVPFSEFEGQMKARYAWPGHGRVTSFASTGRVRVETDAETGHRWAETQVVIEIEHGNPDRPQIVVFLENGQWMIEAWGWFPPRPQVTPAGRGI